MTEPIAPLEVGVLTDEELAVVAGMEGAAVFPVLAAMPDEERVVAMRAAYRSLIARGVVEQAGPDEVDEAYDRGGVAMVDIAVRVPESLATVLEMRRSTELVVAVGRTTGLGEEYCYAYLHGEAVLIEVVSAGGAHRFVVRAAADLLDVVVTWAVNEAATDGVGEPVEVPALQQGDDPRPPQPVLDALGAAFLRADVFVFRPGEDHPPLVGVFSGPRGTWRAVSRLGSGEPVRIEPVPVSRVVADLSALIRG